MRLSFSAGWLIVVFSFLAGCAGAEQGNDSRTLRITGSDTMTRLLQLWGDEFMRRYPGSSVRVEGGGTQKGMRELIRGNADLSSASRPIRPTEMREILGAQGSLPTAILCAKDALSIYVNAQNPLDGFRLEQVRDIFTGRIRNWSALGGTPAEISVAVRQPNSGTHLFFEEHVLSGLEYGPNAVTFPHTEAIVKKVESDPSAIGYGGLPFGSTLKHVAIDGVSPTAENVQNGSYPISRYLYLYSASRPTGIAMEFINFVLSEDGQRISQNAGYIPLYQFP